MVKIIIVEDDKAVQEQIKQVVRKISIQKDINLDIAYFSKYDNNLQKELENTLYPKIYVMDIELENSISGIEIASKIRENDWDSEIIFVTCHDNMFESVHRQILEVFDFIEKFQNMAERLEKDFNKIISKKVDKKMLNIKGKRADVSIYMKNILYILRDKEERKSIIYTDTDQVNFKVNYSLTELLNLLDDRFVQTHKSCLANKERMVERNYAKGYFVLNNGEKVEYLSKKYRKEIDGEWKR